MRVRARGFYEAGRAAGVVWARAGEFGQWGCIDGGVEIGALPEPRVSVLRECAAVGGGCAADGVVSLAAVMAAENAAPRAGVCGHVGAAPFWKFLEGQNLVPVAVRVREVEGAGVSGAATSAAILPVVVRAVGEPGLGPGVGSGVGPYANRSGVGVMPGVLEPVRSGRFLNLMG